jgi:hypothetical protein
LWSSWSKSTILTGLVLGRNDDKIIAMFDSAQFPQVWG